MFRRGAVAIFCLAFAAHLAAAVGAPSISPTGSGYVDSVSVTLATSTKGAAIVYTTDGSDPRTSKTVRTYTKPLTIDKTTKLTAAAKLNKEVSSVATRTYTITAPAPAVLPSSRAFVQTLAVRIAPTHPLGDVTRYTTDGTEPTLKSPLYLDLGAPQLTFNRSTVLKAKTFRTGAEASATTTVAYPRAVVLLLHGLNSNPDVPWKVLVRELFPADSRSIDVLCPRIARSGSSSSTSPCYRAEFQNTTNSGVSWWNGDGESFGEYAADVSGMIDFLVRKGKAPLIILVGHSRGGLSARAYLQSYSRSDVKLALLTLGTPHQGSPLGRIWSFYKTDSRYKLTDADLLAWQKKETPLRFVFAPATISLATDHDAQKKPVRSTVSAAIHDLNAKASSMSKSALAFGQVNSTGLDLGVDLGPFATNLLADVWLKKMVSDGYLPGPFDPNVKALRDYILRNLSTEWNRGDGAVPEASADLRRVFSGTVSTTSFTNRRHTGLSEESGAIVRQLEGLTDTVNKSVSRWTVTAAEEPVPLSASLAEVADREERTVRLLGDLTRAASPGDRAALMVAVAEAGTARGVAALLDEYLVADGERRVAAGYALASVRDEDAIALLARHLDRPGDPLAEISGEALSQIGSPRATAVLLAWARQTLDVGTAERWLSRVRDSRSLQMLLASVERDAYLSYEVQSRLAAVAADIDRQTTPSSE